MGKKNKKTVQDIISPIKTCARCGDVKLLDGFEKDKKGRLGVADVCKKCIEAGKGPEA